MVVAPIPLANVSVDGLFVRQLFNVAAVCAAEILSTSLLKFEELIFRRQENLSTKSEEKTQEK